MTARLVYMDIKIGEMVTGSVMLLFAFFLNMFRRRIEKIEDSAFVGVSAEETRRIAREEQAALDSKIDSLSRGIDAIQKQQTQIMFHLLESKHDKK